jgi:hypothetical protein
MTIDTLEKVLFGYTTEHGIILEPVEPYSALRINTLFVLSECQEDEEPGVVRRVFLKTGAGSVSCDTDEWCLNPVPLTKVRRLLLKGYKNEVQTSG